MCRFHSGSDEKSAEPREEEPKTFTLDEWKAQQQAAAKAKAQPKFNTRKAGEGSEQVRCILL